MCIDLQCAQLDIKGSGNSVPTSSDLVAIPGIYNTHQIAFTGDIWSNPTSWEVDGPAVVSFAGGSGNGSGSNPPPPPRSTSAVSSSTKKIPPHASSTSSAKPHSTSKVAKQCRGRRRRSNLAFPEDSARRDVHGQSSEVHERTVHRARRVAHGKKARNPVL